MNDPRFHTIGDLFSPDALLSLPAVILDDDWDGAMFQPGIRIHLGASPGSIAVAGRFIGTRNYNQNLHSGDFCEGLWEADVFEFFLGDESGAYVEVNLAPSGAWWGASFSGYRIQSGECREGITSESLHRESSWDAMIRITPGRLPIGRPVVFNVCAIVGVSPRRFLSLGRNSTPGAKPDFHLRSNWLPLRG